jgi:hypothetical protein
MRRKPAEIANLVAVGADVLSATRARRMAQVLRGEFNYSEAGNQK